MLLGQRCRRSVPFSQRAPVGSVDVSLVGLSECFLYNSRLALGLITCGLANRLRVVDGQQGGREARREPRFAAFVDLYGVNIPTAADFMWPTVDYKRSTNVLNVCN